MPPHALLPTVEAAAPEWNERARRKEEMASLNSEKDADFGRSPSTQMATEERIFDAEAPSIRCYTCAGGSYG